MHRKIERRKKTTKKRKKQSRKRGHVHKRENGDEELKVWPGGDERNARLETQRWTQDGRGEECED